MVHGLLHETSAEDLSIISKSVVAAYNAAYSVTGYSFTALETTASVSGPDKLDWKWWGPNFWPGCRWCSNDDALTDSNTDAHAQLLFVEVMPVGPTENNAAIHSVQMQDLHLGDLHKKFALETTASVSGPDKLDWKWWGPNDALTDSNTDAQAQVVLAEVMPVVPSGNNAAIHSVQMQELHLGDIHKKFEDNFCGLLRASGSANLASASQCSLSFLETPGHTASVPVESAYRSNDGKAEQAQVIMHGTLHDLSEKDYAVIDTTIVAAFNEAFADTGYAASSFEVVADINMPNNDADALMINAATIVSAKLDWKWWGPNFWPGCRWCSNDDAIALTGSPILKDSDIAFMHEAFEKAFCSKLQNSGLANFANVNNCSFRFVNNPTDGVVEAAQE
jgi:hypothetical protein